MSQLSNTVLGTDTNLKGYWKMEGNSNDTSASGNNGTNTNLTFSAANGKYGQGGGYDGGTSKTDLGTVGLPYAGGDRSLVAWVNPTANQNYGPIFAYGTANGGQGFQWGYNATNANLFVGAYSQNASGASTTNLVNNIWQHVAVVLSGTLLTYYYNGVADGTASLSPAINTISNYARIGKAIPGWDAGDGLYLWKGAIDEVAVFNRTLSAAEVKSLYTAGLIQTIGAANLGLGSTLGTLPSNMTAGNMIVVGVTVTNALSVGTVSSITDGQSNAYTRAIRGTLSEATSVIDEEIWYSAGITGGTGIITVNHTVDNAAIFVREYTGVNTLDVTNSATGSSAAPNTGTVTSTFGTELLVVSTGDDKGATQTYTLASNFQDLVGTTTTLTGLSMEDNAVYATGGQTGSTTFGAAANWVSLLASFYQATPSAIRGWKTLLGVGQG